MDLQIHTFNSVVCLLLVKFINPPFLFPCFVCSLCLKARFSSAQHDVLTRFERSVLHHSNMHPLGAAAQNDFDEDIADASDGDVELRDADELNGDDDDGSEV